jgi:hypothetical protein
MYDQFMGRVFWCSVCACPAIQCPFCRNSSCNGGGCDKCNQDFVDFMKIHYWDIPELNWTIDELRKINSDNQNLYEAKFTQLAKKRGWLRPEPVVGTNINE